MSRYAALLAVSFSACSCPGSSPGGPDASQDVDAAFPPDASTPACGDEDGLPARVTQAGASVLLECDASSAVLAITTFEDGIVRLRYGADDRGSLVPLTRPAERAPLTGRRGASVVLCTSLLTLEAEPGTCRLSARLADGRVLLEDGDGGGWFAGRALATGETTERDVVGVSRRAPPGERLYGLGLHTRAGSGLDLRGRTVELYNTDAYDPGAGGFRPDAPMLYESIPFYLGLRAGAAYGVFTDNTHRTRFDLAATDLFRTTVTAWGGAIDQWLVAGPALRDVVRRYTLLTGRMPLPPRWSLGFHLSRWEGPCDGSPADRPISRWAWAKRVRESIINRTVFPLSRKYSAIVTAANAAFTR